jgi:hypothetical protein
MLFEEFFKKKKINLGALQQGDQELFLEFKEHYEQMGEKSFDHTKKFWFNKLRRQYPLPPEVKAEKLRAENQIAEQTVTDTLTEPSPRDKAPDLNKPQTTNAEVHKPATASPKLGFKPKFKQATAPVHSPEDEPAQPVTNDGETQPGETPVAPVPKAGFKPRFKAGITPPTKPVDETPDAAKESSVNPEIPAGDKAADAPASKMGFKPRFKAGVTTTNKPADEPTTAATAPTKEVEKEVQADQTATDTSSEASAPAKLGFKPRFKAGVTTSRPATETSGPASSPSADAAPTEENTEQPNAATAGEHPAPPKLGFKPRFKAGVTTTKPAEEDTQKPELTKEDTATFPDVPKAEEDKALPAENPAPKPAYKPRFNPNMVKPKPPEGE